MQSRFGFASFYHEKPIRKVENNHEETGSVAGIVPVRTMHRTDSRPER
jgi:hypothetical protein